MTCKFRKKKPMNNSNIDMLVDAEIGGGKKETILEKKMKKKKN
jgi:hypothetical protein